MDDALDLVVEDNEFAGEQPETPTSGLKEEKSDSNFQTSDSNFDKNDYISLCEAKQKLLKDLEEYEMQHEAMVCSRGSVKSRLGERAAPIEEMEICEDDKNGVERRVEERLGAIGHDDSHTTNADPMTKRSTRNNNIPRRPSMKNLCKCLRVRSYDNPVKIGKELAERLEEHKFSLIIEIVKTIGGQKAINLFNETKRIQLSGGMKTCNGLRRRTSGGIFLTLLKSGNYATEQQIKNIFKEDAKMNTEALKRRKALYNKRKRAKKFLAQQEAAKSTNNNKQPENKAMGLCSNVTQPAINIVQPVMNIVQPVSNIVKPVVDSVDNFFNENNMSRPT